MVYSTHVFRANIPDEEIPLYVFNDNDSEVEINNYSDDDSDSDTSVDGAHFVSK